MRRIQDLNKVIQPLPQNPGQDNAGTGGLTCEGKNKTVTSLHFYNTFQHLKLFWNDLQSIRTRENWNQGTFKFKYKVAPLKSESSSMSILPHLQIAVLTMHYRFLHRGVKHKILVRGDISYC